jgi:hypothetical protein
MSKNKVAIIIPFYRESITAYEAIALTQCALVLKDHPIIAIKPNWLTLPDRLKDYPLADVVSFDDAYFKNIQGYNRLMLSQTFYKAFLNYEYILIHQLDAFVFNNELQYWCDQGFDYIGAPWLRKTQPANALKAGVLKLQQYLSIRFNLQKRGLPNKYQFENKVGNGGFSLRRTQKFYHLCITMQAQIAHYLSRDEHQYHEDTFWSIEANRKQKNLYICDYKQALKFAFENSPGRALKLNKNQLPFGCHAWDKHPDFWRPFFKQHNYKI